MTKQERKRLATLALLGVVIVLFALMSGCVGQENATPTQTQTIEDISPGEASALIQSNLENPDFVIIDVRTPEEYADGHVENAVNLDYYSETFGDELDRMDKEKTYLVYCRSAGRSGMASDIMKELGFREVYNMSGGIIQWEAEGLPIVR